ncbi:MAG: outer membrane protein assembly factor BamD [Bdellovibrionaceae bacterium]|nr:outer membrane protein assembly factor BamD [Pseudobdellovibrionaceae bacterium]
MRAANSLFLIVCLSITVALLWSYNEFNAYFSQGKEYQVQVHQLEKKLEKEEFRNALLRNQLVDFQQSVAAVLPPNSQIKNDVANYDLKNFSSSLREPASVAQIDLSGTLFEKGKKLFKEQKYEKSIKEFRKVLEDYPLSRYKTESHFFMAEAYFLQKDYKSSLDLIDQMVVQYPDNDLTGFIMLRMGQISELNNRLEEASEIYKTVEVHFKNDQLRRQASSLNKTLQVE